MYAGCMESYGLSRKVCTFALLLRFIGVSERIPKSGCDEYPTFQAYSVNNLTVLRLQCAPEFAIMRAPARPHTLAPPGLLPLTESGGEETLGRSCCVGSGIYVYI